MHRREWLAFVLVIIIFSVLTVFQAYHQKTPDPYGLASTEPDGVKGFYMLLEEVGFSVSKVTALAGHNGVGIMLFPTFNEIDTLSASLLDWVDAGNYLVILGNPHIYSWDNDEFETQYLAFQKLSRLGNNDHPVISYTHDIGKGSIKVIPDGEICTNKELRQEDNAVHLINALRDFAGKDIYFLNTAIMAQVTAGAQTVWAAIPSAVWLIIIQLVLALLLWLKAATNYLGQPLIKEHHDAPAEDEDILALGRMLHEHKHNKAVLEWLYQLFREDIAFTLGVGPEDDNQTFMTQAVSQYPDNREELLQLQKIRQQQSVSDRDLVKAEHIMGRIRERWLNTNDRTIINPTAD